MATGCTPDLGHAYLVSCIQQPVSIFFHESHGNPDGRNTRGCYAEQRYIRVQGYRSGIIEIRLVEIAHMKKDQRVCPVLHFHVPVMPADNVIFLHAIQIIPAVS